MKYDLFICHASEDKEAIARPLAECLAKKGYRIWFDEFSLALGDSLRRSINKGLQESRFGAVILSHSFFQKQWTNYELDGLTAKEQIGRNKVILPIWHNVSADEVAKYSPVLADRLAVSSALATETVASQIALVLGDPPSPLPKGWTITDDPCPKCGTNLHALDEGDEDQGMTTYSCPNPDCNWWGSYGCP